MTHYRQTERPYRADERFKVRNPLLLATYNVRTLLKPGRFYQLTEGCFKHNLDMIAVQEHRWNAQEEISAFNSEHYQFLYSAASERRQGGVGILVRNKLVHCIIQRKKISSRILSVTLNCNPKVTVVAAYAPTEDALSEAKEEFYTDLSEYLLTVPSHNFLAVLGDFNARIGPDMHRTAPSVVGRYTFHESTNDNGHRLVELCDMTNLFSAFQRQPHKRCHMWSCQHPDGAKAQLDHILMRRRWANSLRNCRSYSSIEIDSDHRIVTATTKISLRVGGKKQASEKPIDYTSLTIDRDIRRKFVLELHNRFSVLDDSGECQQQYDNFVSTIRSTAEATLPKKKKMVKSQPVSQRSVNLMNKRATARKNFHNHRNQENYCIWRSLVDETDRSFEDDHRRSIEEACNQATLAAKQNNTKGVFTIIRQLSGKTQSSSVLNVKKRNGEPPASNEELLTEWASYFEELLNNDIGSNEDRRQDEHIQTSGPELQISTDDFTLEETVLAISTMKRGRSPGCDDITAEALQYSGHVAAEKLKEICNKVLNGDSPPTQWRENLIVPIPKKPSVQMTHFRGISLMSVAAKVFNRLLLNRIYDEVNSKLRPFQAGFRRGMCCAEQIHTLRRITEGFHQKQLPVIVTFIDFSKAFDSINREVMWKILAHYGIPLKIINAIKALYTNSTSRVKVGAQQTDQFPVRTGVLQGDTLAPFLFTIVLDFVLQRTHTNENFGIVTHLDTNIPKLADLDFADDIALFDDSITSAIQHVDTLQEKASTVGLRINYNKTKARVVNITDSQSNLEVGNEQIEIVEDFKYLGSKILSSMTDFLQRRGIAWSNFWRLQRVWQSNQLPLHLKLRLFDALIIPVLLYGSESWTISQTMCDRINAFGTSCYRIMLGVKRTDRVRNTVILQTVNRPALCNIVYRRQLKALGHWLRKDGSIAQRYALYIPSHGRNRRGRPRLSYVRHIETITGLAANDIGASAADRDGWRSSVVGRYDARPPD